MRYYKLLKSLVGLACLASVFTACQKEYNPDLGTTPTTIPTQSATDYFPTTTNSYWSYTLDITGDTVLLSVSPNNATINGVSYKVFQASDTTGVLSSSYYRKDNNGLYYEYGDIDYAGVLDSVGEDIDYIFLKDNVALNTSWETPEVNAKYNGATGKAKAKLTITGKDIQQTINGATVDSVIKVTRETMFKSTSASSYSTVASSSINTYFARNKGLLLLEGTLPPPLPAVPFKLEAKRYKIY